MFRRKASRFEQVKSAHLPKSPATEQKVSKMERPHVSTGKFILMMELRKKIILFRDVVDLPPRIGSVSVNELVIGTLKDLHRFYPEIITRSKLSEMKRQTLNKVLFYFCDALKTIGDSWMMNSEWMDKATLNMYNNNKHHKSERIVEIALATLDCMIKIPKETFDRMAEDEKEEDEDEQMTYSPLNSPFKKISARSHSGSPTSSCASPLTPTSVLPEYLGSPSLEAFANISGSSPLLRSLRAQALGKLNPIDIKYLSFHMQSDMGSKACSHVNQKNAVEDETREEMEAEYKSLHQRNNSDDELMFEMAMEASTIPEIREHATLEGTRSSTATPDSAKVIPQNPEATKLQTPTPQVLPDAAASPNLTVSTEVKEVEASVPPPSTIISGPNDKMQFPSSQSPPPPPPLPPLLIVQQNVASIHPSLPPTMPPPASPVLMVAVALETKSESQVPVLQPNVTTNGTSLPPQFPNLPMEAITVTSEMLPPPPPPFLPMKLGNFTMKPLPLPTLSKQLEASITPPPPPPPPPPIKLEIKETATPPPVFPMHAGGLQTAILQPPAPSIQLGSFRTVLPPQLPCPSPPMQLATTSKTSSQLPPPTQLGSQKTLKSQPPFPPALSPPPMQPEIITPMTEPPPPPEMSMSTFAATTPPPPPMTPSKGPNVMATLLSPPPSSRGSNETIGAPPPPPPMMSSKGPNATRGPPPPPPPVMVSSKGTMPPPPPGAARSLRPKKAQTKLKRSAQIGNLYRVLKGKVEGVNQNSKSNNGRTVSAPSGAGGTQSMADALAEMTKRSAYFQQIEEDVRRYTKSILELKTSISNFQTKDMTELIKFHSHVESILENLADETQVLARFEGFPQKKLEALRMATALYSKLNGVIIDLHNWKIEAPLGQLLERTERYFSKIKGEMESLERTKDDESKKFQSHNIHFDFHILVQIKEAIVDVSSNCMELALKERREAAGTTETGQKPEHKKACVKMLWKAFQFAFKVYSFAGGHDDRADELTRELAHEIQTDPHHQ